MIGHERGGDCSLMRRFGDDFSNGAWTGVRVYPYLHVVTPYFPYLPSNLSHGGQNVFLDKISGHLLSASNLP